MIEKLDSKMDCVEITVLGKHTECLGFDSAKEIGKKLNELVDAVNKLETMAKNTNTVLESLVQENNIHEKQIDELQMKVEPKKCEIPAENVQDSAICNTYTYIRWDELCRLREIADKYAEITGHKGFQNE